MLRIQEGDFYDLINLIDINLNKQKHMPCLAYAFVLYFGIWFYFVNDNVTLTLPLPKMFLSWLALSPWILPILVRLQAFVS